VFAHSRFVENLSSPLMVDQVHRIFLLKNNSTPKTPTNFAVSPLPIREIKRGLRIFKKTPNFQK
jgi:hypothetical protein